MLSTLDFAPARSPAQALRASLAASGLLRHPAELREDTGHESARAIAHAIHQGDRLLRTARSLLVVHARTHGDFCSLWAGDGPDVVAVICDLGVIEPSHVAPLASVGTRLSVGIEALRLQEYVGTDPPWPPAVQAEQDRWSALFRHARRCKPGTVDDFGSRTLASVLPWRPCPMVLMTIDADPTLPASSHLTIRLGHHHRHESLGQCLAWALDTVVR